MKIKKESNVHNQNIQNSKFFQSPLFEVIKTFLFSNTTARYVNYLNIRDDRSPFRIV
jgi:hypothetical protein